MNISSIKFSTVIVAFASICTTQVKAEPIEFLTVKCSTAQIKSATEAIVIIPEKTVKVRLSDNEKAAQVIGQAGDMTIKVHSPFSIASPIITLEAISKNHSVETSRDISNLNGNILHLAFSTPRGKISTLCSVEVE